MYINKLRSRIVTFVVITAISSSCVFGKEEVSGMVIDVTTGNPLSGAYVMAVYKKAGGVWMGHSSSWCVRTSGMFTGSNGKYLFPAEGNGPEVVVIKPDYYQTFDANDIRRPPWNGKGKNPADADPNLYLKQQGITKPKFNFTPVCERPKSKEDVLANIQYIKLSIAEITKYSKVPKIDDLLQSIKYLESVPEK